MKKQYLMPEMECHWSVSTQPLCGSDAAKLSITALEDDALTNRRSSRSAVMDALASEEEEETDAWSEGLW